VISSHRLTSRPQHWLHTVWRPYRAAIRLVVTHPPQIQFSGCLIDLLISAQVQFGTALFFLKIGKYDYNLIILVAND